MISFQRECLNQTFYNLDIFGFVADIFSDQAVDHFFNDLSIFIITFEWTSWILLLFFLKILIISFLLLISIKLLLLARLRILSQPLLTGRLFRS